MQTYQSTFYWYDYETWGLNPSLDMPAQFAGIRTDMDFNPINNPDMFYCRLSNDYLPDPEAVLINGITPEITQSQGLTEAMFARKINQQFIQANTCIVGYNTIRFDEEFSRNIFYRNFFEPYEYTYKHGNSRWDIIDLARSTYALRPEGIVWPKDKQGLPSFKLELLTSENGISHESAHEATSDVYATIALAKLIQQKSPKIFKYYFNLRHKHKVKELIDTKHCVPLVHVSGMFGANKNNTSLVVPIAWHPKNNNAVIAVNLAQNILPLLDLSADDIRESLYTKHEDLGTKLPIPLKLIHINKCPFLAPIKTLTFANAERLGIDYKSCLANLDLLKTNNTKLVKCIAKVYQDGFKFDPKGNVNTRLYDGFFTTSDKKEFKKIHNLIPEKLSTLKLNVTDQRFPELFFNYRARNFPKTLTKAEQKQWAEHCPTALTIKDYLLKLETIFTQFNPDKKQTNRLNALLKYVKTLI